MTAPLPKLDRIPADIVSVCDYEALARDRLTPQIFAYVSGGAADEITLRRNRSVFDRLPLRGRVLHDMAGATRALSMFGQAFESPILFAPVAYQTLFHPDGERATALAASATRTGMIVSTQAGIPVEDIARDATAPLWFQLYVQPDRDFTRDLVRRIEQAGYSALVVTVDAPVSGMRDRERRAGFVLPAGVEAVNLRGMRSLPQQTLHVGGKMLLGGTLLDAAPTWRDIAWLKSITSLPVLIKGVMTAEDAAKAIAEGVDGIIVSNHGGRVLDTVPATIEVLPEIAAAIGGRVPLLMDGGIRRGTDIVKAVALGAKAVLIGRPYVYALAAAGAVGVAHVIQMLLAELEVAMALTGCRNLDEIGPSLVRAPEPYGSSSVSQ
jgi:4-hydroxymandelate oxidase